MRIKSVKIEMRKKYCNAVGEPQIIKYKPIATITYKEKDRPKKQVFLDNRMVEKGYFKCWTVCEYFFVGTTNDFYLVYNEEGVRTGTILIERAGKLIQTNEESIIFFKDNEAYVIDSNGFSFAGIKLTNKEVRLLTE